MDLLLLQCFRLQRSGTQRIKWISSEANYVITSLCLIVETITHISNILTMLSAHLMLINRFHCIAHRHQGNLINWFHCIAHSHQGNCIILDILSYHQHHLILLPKTILLLVFHFHSYTINYLLIYSVSFPWTCCYFNVSDYRDQALNASSGYHQRPGQGKLCHHFSVSYRRNLFILHIKILIILYNNISYCKKNIPALHC